MRPRSILLVHQSLQPPGGANAVGAWVVEALKGEYALTILTWDPIDTRTLNHSRRRFLGDLAGASVALVATDRSRPRQSSARGVLDARLSQNSGSL